MKTNTIIERGILFFWASWSTLVLLTDSIDFLQHIHWMPTTLALTSKNFELVAKSLATYQWDNAQLVLTLYGIIILGSLFIAGLFWRATFASRKTPEVYQAKAQHAFIAILAMTAIFLLADEIFIQYEFGHGHMARLGFILLTYLVFMRINT